MIDMRIQRQSRISADEEERLFQLHSRFFQNLDRDVFHEDFREKDWVITVSEGQDPVAFSTIRLYQETTDGRSVWILFSGDTVVHPDYWSRNLLVPPFGAFLARLMEERSGEEVYWFLITKGYRTFMFLPVFFRQFVPAVENDAPPAWKQLLDTVARRRFPDCYDPCTGIVSHCGKRDFLVPELREVPESRRDGRWVRFFLEKNPGYVRGDELCCLTRISRENIRPLGLKMLEFKDCPWQD
jgi:hypothetical protein